MKQNSIASQIQQFSASEVYLITIQLNLNNAPFIVLPCHWSFQFANYPHIANIS